jgi:hypothetical protein
MRLDQYRERHGRGVLRELGKRCEGRVSYTTIIAVANGLVLKNYEKARAISEATGGEVSVDELCSPPPQVRSRRAA